MGSVRISNINLIVTANPQDESFRWRISNIYRGPDRKMLGNFCSFLGTLEELQKLLMSIFVYESETLILLR